MKTISRPAAFIVTTAAALCLLAPPAAAQNYNYPSPASPKTTTTPAPKTSVSTNITTAPTGQTPGESNPAAALIATLSIAIAGAAGIVIYRAIKKGL
jgi:hypothetical protein